MSFAASMGAIQVAAEKFFDPDFRFSVNDGDQDYRGTFNLNDRTVIMEDAGYLGEADAVIVANRAQFTAVPLQGDGIKCTGTNSDSDTELFRVITAVPDGSAVTITLKRQ